MDQSENNIILKATEENLNKCASILMEGDVVAVPTETVYGLAGNALNESSLNRIFSVKDRPLFDPLIVHVASIEQAFEYIEHNNEIEQLANVFWPGPLTIIAKKRSTIPDLATAGLPSVAIRSPSHPVLRTLLQKVPFPLAAPSANPFGYVSPTTAEHVETTLGKKIKAILDGGSCQFGLESTIIDLREPQNPKILRQGPITQSTLGRALPGYKFTEYKPRKSNKLNQAAQIGPGLLSKHYSPATPVKLFENESHPNLGNDLPKLGRIAIIYQKKPTIFDANLDTQIFWLSANGNLEENARNLFAVMQEADTLNYDYIYIEKALQSGIGVAMNDRLIRASTKK